MYRKELIQKLLKKKQAHCKNKVKKYLKQNATLMPNFNSDDEHLVDFRNTIMSKDGSRVLQLDRCEEDYKRVNHDIRQKLSMWSPHRLQSPARLRNLIEQINSIRALSPNNSRLIKSTYKGELSNT